MKNDDHMDRIFQEAVKAINEDDLKLARERLLTIILIYPDDSKIAAIYALLGQVCDDMDDLEAARENFEKATELRPDYEMPSQGLHYMYADLGHHEKAFLEMKRYLDSYPAKLYKETLQDLLHDLKNGHMAAYSEEIIALAVKNGVF